MLTVWQTIRKAELAQENILKRLQDFSLKSDSLSASEENQFLSKDMMHEIQCSNFNSFSQSIVKECQQVSCSIQEDKSIYKSQNTFSIGFNLKGHQFQISVDEENPIDFEAVVQNVEQSIGQKLSQKGIEKVLGTLKVEIDELKNCSSNQVSVKQSKIDQKSTRKNSMISRGNPTQKSNKENCFKIGHTNYQLMSKVKKSQASNINGGKVFGVQKFSKN